MKIAILGVGEVGLYLARRLADLGHQMTLLDCSSEVLFQAEEEVDASTLKGNALHWQTLKRLGAEDLDLLIGVTGSDSTNLVACHRAREMGAKSTIARVDDPFYFPGRQHVQTEAGGESSAVCVTRLVGLELIRQVLQIDCESVFEFCGYGLGIAHYRIASDNSFVEQAVSQWGSLGGGRVCGVIRNGLFREPQAVQNFAPDDVLVIGGSFDQLLQAIKALKGEQITRKAVIIGGGNVGMQVAQSLSGYEERIELVEPDRGRCQDLSEGLSGVSVLHGDGTDIDLLQELRLGKQDYMISVAKTDEINLMTALVGKELGVGKTFTRLNRPGYNGVYKHLYVDETASPHAVMNRFVHGQLTLHTSSRAQSSGFSHDYFEIRLGSLGARELHVEALKLPAMVSLLGLIRRHEAIHVERSGILFSGDSLVFAGPSSSVKATLAAVRKAYARA